MAQLDQDFNANEYQDMNSFDVVPVGRYKAVMTESEWKSTKAGTGEYLNVAFEIIEGEFKGSKIFRMLNLHNPNDKAVQIAKKELASICRAAGMISPRDSSMLHNKPMEIDVTIEPGTGGYADKNGIKMYYPIGSVGQQDEIPFSAPAPAGKKPWEK